MKILCGLVRARIYVDSVSLISFLFSLIYCTLLIVNKVFVELVALGDFRLISSETQTECVNGFLLFLFFSPEKRQTDPSKLSKQHFNDFRVLVQNM